MKKLYRRLDFITMYGTDLNIDLTQQHYFQDIVNKLTHLMWNDWHAEVRKAAAHTLGKSGHGKDVHDEFEREDPAW